MSPHLVTPFVGVWIETDRLAQDVSAFLGSHPSWVCGLKPQKKVVPLGWIKVTPFVGVWIET